MGICLTKPQAEELHCTDCCSQITANSQTLTGPLSPTSTAPLKACLSTAVLHTASKTPSIFASQHSLGNGLILVALYQGHGANVNASQAAAFFHNNLLSVYRDTPQAQPTDTLLKTVLQKLDALYISKRAKEAVHSGCAAALVLLNLETLVCTVANVGDVQCELTSVSGSFNSKRPCTQRLSTLHSLENVAEKARHERRSKNNTTTSTTDNNNDTTSTSSSNNRVTRLLGMTASRSSSPSQQCEPSVYQTTLQPSNQAIILSSSSVWQNLSPAEAAYKTHLYDQMMMNQAPEAVAISPAVVDNTAKHVLHHVVSKAAQRYGASTNQPFFSIQDILNFPLNRPVGGGGEDEEVVYMPATPTTAARQQLHLQSHRLLVQPTLREVLTQGDLGIAVISLRSYKNTIPTTTSTSNTIPKSLHYSQDDSMSALAQRRWSLVKNHVEYLRLHRRECLLRWHETVEIAMKKGRAQARAYEHQIKWHCGELVKVTPGSMKVLKRDGSVVGIEAYRGNIDW